MVLVLRSVGSEQQSLQRWLGSWVLGIPYNVFGGITWQKFRHFCKLPAALPKEKGAPIPQSGDLIFLLLLFSMETPTRSPRGCAQEHERLAMSFKTWKSKLSFSDTKSARLKYFLFYLR